MVALVVVDAYAYDVCDACDACVCGDVCGGGGDVCGACGAHVHDH